MREILFRGKDKQNGQWLYGSLFKSKHGVAILVNKYEDISYEEIGFGRSWVFPEELFTGYEVDPETVGQLWIFNDCRLFGGDLFTAECVVGDSGIAKRLCKVVDSEDGFNPKVWYNGEWWSYSYMNYTTFKLVGNIFDNPELLK